MRRPSFRLSPYTKGQALIALAVVLVVASCSGIFQVVIPCRSDSARPPADTIISCDALDSLARRPRP